MSLHGLIVWATLSFTAGSTVMIAAEKKISVKDTAIIVLDLMILELLIFKIGGFL